MRRGLFDSGETRPQRTQKAGQVGQTLGRTTNRVKIADHQASGKRDKLNANFNGQKHLHLQWLGERGWTDVELVVVCGPGPRPPWMLCRLCGEHCGDEGRTETDR